MYLLDTNVISEARKGARMNPGVQDFLSKVDDRSLFLSVVTLGEIRRGIELLSQRGDRAGADRLDIWLTQLRSDFSNRWLEFDGECSLMWGRLMAPDKAHPIDKQIAATALIYDLTVVTRNTADFTGTGVRLENPFQ